MIAIDAFLDRIDAFLAKSGLSVSRFGDLACNDPAFVFDLRAGREPKISTIAKVDNFMNSYGASDPADGDVPGADHPEPPAADGPPPNSIRVLKAAAL